ncbi:MAG: succinate dehydrogenase, cytochrome b556 subunit [Gammaproteobacteria bacterium]|nr:succinate dehydrogenase, cytochrome b556 subunit [Gammaproteobacteria bacterium]
MTRPVNLDLTAFRFPIAAIASILHRISGVVLLFGVGYFTYLLSLTLESPESFDWVFNAVGTTYHGVLAWTVLTAVSYHFFAGIRHLLMDFHIGISLRASSRSAWTTLILTALASIGFGLWIVT